MEEQFQLCQKKHIKRQTNISNQDSQEVILSQDVKIKRKNQQIPIVPPNQEKQKLDPMQMLQSSQIDNLQMNNQQILPPKQVNAQSISSIKSTFTVISTQPSGENCNNVNKNSGLCQQQLEEHQIHNSISPSCEKLFGIVSEDKLKSTSYIFGFFLKFLDNLVFYDDEQQSKSKMIMNLLQMFLIIIISLGIFKLYFLWLDFIGN